MIARQDIHQESGERENVRAISACLRIILDDMRARYRYLMTEIDRLQKAGVAAAEIYQRFELERKEVKSEYAPPDPDRRIRHARV